ncbi:MAG TPA: hypothetical protein VGC91_09860 [Pyrinomonadaceae bacterium]
MLGFSVQTRRAGQLRFSEEQHTGSRDEAQGNPNSSPESRHAPQARAAFSFLVRIKKRLSSLMKGKLLDKVGCVADEEARQALFAVTV